MCSFAAMLFKRRYSLDLEKCIFLAIAELFIPCRSNSASSRCLGVSSIRIFRNPLVLCSQNCRRLYRPNSGSSRFSYASVQRVCMLTQVASTLDGYSCADHDVSALEQHLKAQRFTACLGETPLRF